MRSTLVVSYPWACGCSRCREAARDAGDLRIGGTGPDSRPSQETFACHTPEAANGFPQRAGRPGGGEGGQARMRRRVGADPLCRGISVDGPVLGGTAACNGAWRLFPPTTWSTPPALAVPPFEHGTRGRARSAEASWSRSTGCRSPSRSTSPASPAATVTAPMWLFERQLLYCGGRRRMLARCSGTLPPRLHLLVERPGVTAVARFHRPPRKRLRSDVGEDPPGRYAVLE